MIIERKTWGDLVSSLTGSRLERTDRSDRGQSAAKPSATCPPRGARKGARLERILRSDFKQVRGLHARQIRVGGFLGCQNRDTAHTADVVLACRTVQEWKGSELTPEFTFRG